MSGWHAFLTAFCTVSVLLGGIGLLCPDGKMKKSVQYVLATVFLLTLLSAVPLIKLSNTGQADPAVQAVYSSEELKKAACEQTFRTALQMAEIQFSQIRIDTDILSDGSIKIKKVTVFSNAPAEQIETALDASVADYEVEIIHE